MSFKHLAVVLYSVPVPYAVLGEEVREEVIEVYGEPDMGWYEWRVVRVEVSQFTYCVRRIILRDSKDQGYGCAEVALRDALVETTKDL